MTFFQLITPVNLYSEKEEFLKSHNYNPIFEYNWTSEFKGIDYELPEKYFTLRDAILEQNYKKIVEEAQSIFETKIDGGLLSESKSYLNKFKDTRNEESLELLVSEFEKTLARFKIDYKVVVSKNEGFNIRPLHKDRIVEISKNPSLQFFKIKHVLKHEMLHIVRAENSNVNGIKKSRNYLPTEEGLASYVQDYEGEDPTSSVFQHAAEYAVTEIAIKSSLREAFNYLVDLGFSKDNAWKRAVRHKYGFIDTSQPGDIMKPSMYFYNANKIKQLSLGEKVRLMNGKISIADLPIYKEYNGVFSEELIRSYFFS